MVRKKDPSPDFCDWTRTHSMKRIRPLVLLTACAILLLSVVALRAAPGRSILLRSSWQTTNIGDIDHTPGFLALAQTYAPDSEVVLWPVDIGGEVGAMLRRKFPALRIVKGRIVDGQPDTPELKAAFESADLLIHGSGPDVRAGDLNAWAKLTGKPYGLYGVTVDRNSEFYRFSGKPVGVLEPELRAALDHAAFVYCRDTTSLAFLQKEKVAPSVLGFAPDAVFAVNLADEAGATAWRNSVGLKEDGYLCVIPRFRFAPYYLIRGEQMTERDRSKVDYNLLYTETDMAKLRGCIVAWVRQTHQWVAICPEMIYEMALGKSELLDKLPEDVRTHVVVHDAYWLPDEAASVYARATALLSMECHSPIIAAVQGVPSIYLHTPTETSKGQMWRDVGLNSSILELDATSGADLEAAILAVERSQTDAKENLHRAMDFIHQRQRETMEVVVRTLVGSTR